MPMVGYTLQRSASDNIHPKHYSHAKEALTKHFRFYYHRSITSMDDNWASIFGPAAPEPLCEHVLLVVEVTNIV